MPAFRNVKTRRSSGRIWSKSAIVYDEDEWEIPPHAGMLLNIPTHSEMPSPHSSATSPSVASVDSNFEVYPVRKSKGKAKATHPSDSDYVPRPKNAFILFRSYFYQTCGGSDQNQISVDAGKAWKALPFEQKRPFQLAADREKQEHQARYPYYNYSPGSRMGVVKRKNSAAKKKKTQPSAKKSLVVPPSTHRDSRRPSWMKVEPNHVTIPSSTLPSLTPPSPIVSRIEEPAIELPNLDVVPQSEPVFSTNWSFESAFVPTSEIPSLDLSPLKSKKEWNNDIRGLKPLSSLRPPNFDTSNEPFCFSSSPVSVGSYLDTISVPVPNFQSESKNEGLEQLLSSSNLYALSTSSPEFQTWDFDNANHIGPLELSYVGYPTQPGVADHNWQLDFSPMDEDLAMGDNTHSKPSLLIAAGLSGIPMYLSPTFNDCEMDQYVDYDECDV